MGKLKGYVQDFLETVGYEAGYDWDNLPSLEKMDELMELDSLVNNNPDDGSWVGR